MSAQEATALENNNGDGFPLAVGDNGGIWMCVASRGPGKGKRDFAARLEASAEESFHLAVTFIAINAARLRPWLSQGDNSRVGLFTRCQDLHLSLGELDVKKNGPSASACAAFSLLNLISRLTLKEQLVMVTGDLDLRGRMRNIGGAKLKLEAAMETNVGLFILPDETWTLLESGRFEEPIRLWEPELQEYARRVVRPAKTLVDVMQIAIKGEWEE
jgi:ATP-dependent Lon protease